MLKRLVSRTTKQERQEIAPWIAAPKFCIDQLWESGYVSRLRDLEKKVEVLSQLLDMEVQRLECIDGIDELDRQFKEWDEQARVEKNSHDFFSNNERTTVK
ncbi:MAG: hypothetical protein Q6373_009585 [Candidatus Sigynarchaeota archaeon]